MRRREFITLLGGTAAAWPLVSRAQQAATADHRNSSCWSSSPWIRRLCSDCVNWAGLGHHRDGVSLVRGKSRTPSRDRRRVRPAQGRRHSLDFNRRLSTFKQATEVIPIVFALSKPIRGGVIASLARPGGNVTGLSILSTDIASKRLELLREAMPGIGRLAVIANAGNPRDRVGSGGTIKAVARTLGIEIASLEIQQAPDIAARLEALRQMLHRGDLLVPATVLATSAFRTVAIADNVQ